MNGSDDAGHQPPRELDLREWLAQHAVMQSPPDLSLDQPAVWAAIDRRGAAVPRRRGRWAWSGLALAAAASLLWVGLSRPHARSPQVHAPSAAEPAGILRPARPVAVGPVAQMRMTGLNTGWILTAADAVLRTQSGGQQWQTVTPPGLAPAPAGALVRLTADGRHNVWVAEDLPHQSVTIYHSTNAGRTWSASRVAPIPFGGGGVQIVFASPDVGWLEVLTAGNASPSAALYGTTNGGASWRELTASTASTPSHLPFGGLLTFASASRGWVVGAPRAAGQVPWQYYLATTSDGGRTWVRATLPTPASLAHVYAPNLTLLPVQALPDGPALVGVVYQTASGATELVVYRQSRSTGAWRVEGRLHAEATQATLGASPPLLTFSSASDGWATLDGALYRTTDGGQQWQTLYRNPVVTRWAALHFTSAHTGWLLDANGHLWDTVDGGRVWTQATR